MALLNMTYRACLGLIATAFLFGLEAKATETYKSTSKNLPKFTLSATLRPYHTEEKPKTNNEFAAYYTNRTYSLNNPVNVNTLGGFLEKSRDYTALELNNWIFYNRLSMVQNRDFDYDELGLDLVQNGFERAGNDLAIYQGAKMYGEDLANGAKDYVAKKAGIPALKFCFGKNTGEKISRWIFPDISFDLGFGGDPMNIRDPLTGATRNYDIDLSFGKLRAYLGGHNRLALELRPNRVSLSLRNYKYGPGSFSFSLSARETEFSPFSGRFSWNNEFSTVAEANYTIPFKNGTLAIGAAQSNALGNLESKDKADITSFYLTGNFTF